MNILDITTDMFPLYYIENLTKNNEWITFTVEPFPDEESAEQHLKLIADEYCGGDKSRLRISEYNSSHWEEQLLKAVKHSDAVQEAAIAAFIDSRRSVEPAIPEPTETVERTAKS